MIIRRTNVYRLEPTVEQEARLAQTAGACRVLYNLALEQRMMWRPGRPPITLKSQSRELTDLRNEIPWMRDAPVHALQSALKNLDRAYVNFFQGRARYPKFKKKGDGDGFHLKDKAYLGLRQLNRNKGELRLAKLGWVKFRGFRHLGGDLRNISITRRAGHWYASVAWQLEVSESPSSVMPAIGIDRGVKIFAALSNGTNYVAPAYFKSIENRLANANRKLARQVKGSAHWQKTKERVSRLSRSAANARRDFLHKTSTTIAKSHGLVAIEKMQINNMSRSARGTIEDPGRNVKSKSGLNRAILDQGWGMFSTLLAYKLEQRGGHLVEVPPMYTSQTCAECGTVSKDSRKSQAVFSCVGCGHIANADTNAARNILRLGHSRRACQANHTGGRQQELSRETANA